MITVKKINILNVTKYVVSVFKNRLVLGLWWSWMLDRGQW